jgi:hypothetical protein
VARTGRRILKETGANGMAVGMVQIMQSMSEGEQASETARTRVAVLSEFLL